MRFHGENKDMMMPLESKFRYVIAFLCSLPCGVGTAATPAAAAPGRVLERSIESKLGTVLLPRKPATIKVEYTEYSAESKKLFVQAAFASKQTSVHLDVYDADATKTIGRLKRISTYIYRGEFALETIPAKITIKSNLGTLVTAPVTLPKLKKTKPTETSRPTPRALSS